jgi:UDP-N-acetylmuramyl pentapeptide phosphotransferase/UDP-N-acetylglucosamine-1-phosphate transferase
MLARSRLVEVLVDQPNERSLHEAPTPRLGGLGLMAGALPVAAWFGGDRLGVALACASALALLSAVDDWRSLPVQVRLPAHLVAAIVAVLALAAPSAGAAVMDTWVAIAVVFALVWMSNLYNFMDGSDALAGLMALIGFGAYAVAATIAGSMSLAFVSAAIAAAAAGFLTFNFPPARVFLGDAGSVPLGFLAGALGMQGAVAGDWPWWFPILVFSPFIVDATMTIVKRLIRGERIWIAHREHYYQRLVLQGWSPRRLALCAAMLMGAVAVSAVAALSASEMLQCGIIAGWSVAFVFLLAAGEAMNRKNKNGNRARQSNRTSGGQQ